MRLHTLLVTQLLFLALPAVPAGAGGDAPDRDGRLRVAASIYPVAMLVEEIGGDRVDVTTVVPPGTDPHHFELTPSSARAVHGSDIVFMIGGDFDSWIAGEGGRRAARPVRICFHEAFTDSLIELGATFNPHFWLDPLFAGKMGERIGLALIGLDPAHRHYYEERIAAFEARVDSLHSEVARRIAATGVKAFVSYHPAWTYFARRYGLVEVGVVERYPEQEPSPRWVADLIREIERRKVKLMIVEETSDPGVIKGLVADTGVEVIVLDPVGNPDDPGRDDYFDLINHNVGVIERAARHD